MFPPGNADAATALDEHLRYRQAWFADLVGPLLVPARDWAAFVTAHREAASPGVAVVVIGATELPGENPTGVRVVGYETPVHDLPLPVSPPETGLAAEITPGAGGSRVLAAVAEQARSGCPVVAKYRTGGTAADAFPDETTLAEVISECVQVGAPFKL